MAKQDKEIKEQIIELLTTQLTIKSVCSQLNLSRNSVYRWLKEDKGFAKEVKEAKKVCVQYLNDECESRVITKIMNDDSNMIKFWLRYRHEDYKQSYIVTK